MARPEISIAVGSPIGRHSSFVKIWVHKNDVYLLESGNMGKIAKYSFHESRRCRKAFVQEHPLPDAMEDRALMKWDRAPTPDAGSGQGVALLTLVFPEGHLAEELPLPSKPSLWLAAPPLSHARVARLMLVKEDKEAVEELISRACQTLVWFCRLPNGEAVCLTSWCRPQKEIGLLVPASRGAAHDFVFPESRSDGWARPMSLISSTFDDHPTLTFLSGFREAPGEGRKFFPNLGTLKRTQVIQSSAHLAGGKAI